MYLYVPLRHAALNILGWGNIWSTSDSMFSNIFKFCGTNMSLARFAAIVGYAGVIPHQSTHQTGLLFVLIYLHLQASGPSDLPWEVLYLYLKWHILIYALLGDLDSVGFIYGGSIWYFLLNSFNQEALVGWEVQAAVRNGQFAHLDPAVIGFQS